MINKDYGKLIDGDIEYAPYELKVGTMIMCPPSKEDYISLGYKEIIVNNQISKNCYDIERNIIENSTQIIIDWILIPMTNDKIKEVRDLQYQMRSDLIFLKYQMELSRGNTEEANQLLSQWNTECELIKQEYPYFNN